MAVEITWIGHASFRLAGSRVVYIDPWKIPDSPADGNVVFSSHIHDDHCSPDDVAKVIAADGVAVGPPDVIQEIGSGRALSPGETIEVGGVKVTGVPAYNVGNDCHPKDKNWLGAVIEMDGVRIYYGGDTDRVDEMSDLTDIDVAILPIGGTYTLDAIEAAKAVEMIGAKAAIPCHFGDFVGTVADAERFAAAAPCKVHILAAGGSVTV